MINYDNPRTVVMNLRNGTKQLYTIPPINAVIAAYAQDKNDWNTWDYDRYTNIVEYTAHCVTAGDFSAFICSCHHLEI